LIYQRKDVPPVNAGLVLVAAPYVPTDNPPVSASVAAKVPPYSPAWPSRSPEAPEASYEACLHYNNLTVRWFRKLEGARPPNLTASVLEGPS
jgi:hypothetical protein